MSIPEGLSWDEMTILQKMRSALQPKGTANVVHLQMGNPFVDYDFVADCLQELEMMPIRAAMGDAPSKLEKLAFMLLCDSAFIDLTGAEDSARSRVAQP